MKVDFTISDQLIFHGISRKVVYKLLVDDTRSVTPTSLLFCGSKRNSSRTDRPLLCPLTGYDGVSQI